MANQVKKQMTPEQFNQKKNDLKATESIDLQGDNGTYVGLGLQLGYHYDGITLTVTVDKAPPFMTGHVVSKLTEWLNA